ncbi:MAG: MazG family protein [Rothia sp. (in: high G+C Gram-positive bacteria)]|nr:MazG family protein [Rothia sp. (in: high G+C Gram-positive bacteria)]
MAELKDAGAQFERLVKIMDTLRSPGGCPWDGEQTHQSLLRYLIEEAYEVVEAIEAPAGVDRALLKEELGDVLLQVVFHSRVAEETSAADGGFSIVEVLTALNDKLERRHPYVFGDEEAATGEDVLARWDDLKKKEKPERTGALDGIPPHLPALALAEKTISKASKAGLLDAHEVAGGQTFADEAELGEHFFSLAAAAKAQGFDPERALRTYTREIIKKYS